MKSSLSILLTLLLILASQPLCQADPSDSNPEAFFAARAKSAKELEGLYVAAKAVIDKSEKSNPASLNAKVLGDIGYKLRMLQYGATRLACYSETAATDFQHRHAKLNVRLNAILAKFRATPAGKKAVAKTLAEMNSRTFQTKRSNSQTQLKSLIRSAKYDQAEQLMLGIYKAMDPLSTIYPDGQVYRPFGDDLFVLEKTLNVQATKAAGESHAQQRKTLDPDFSGTLASFDRAISGIGSTGKASWEDTEVTGPQLLTKIGETWAKKQVAGLRCRTFDCLMQVGGKGKPTAFEESCDKFGIDVVSAIVKLIEADTARVDGANAKALYIEYLASIAPLVGQTSDDLMIQQKTRVALEKLVAKSPELKNQVDNYRMATEDQLFWRKRASEKMAAQRLTAYPLLDATHFKSNLSTPQKTRIYPKPSSRPAANSAVLLSSAPVVINNASGELLNANVTCDHLLRYKSSKGLSSRAISRYRSRCYAIVPVLAGELTIVGHAALDLKTDLMVSEQAPALTLEATYAVVTADRAELMRVGGDIGSMTLESFATRFGNLKDSASIMIPLGKIVSEDLKSHPPGAHVLMRYSINPHWVQHDYFFVDGLKPEGS